jgi:heterodisulfide reductase subunit A
MAINTVLVIGGGPAGLEAASGAAGLGAQVIVVEERTHLGGTPVFEQYAALTHGFQDAETIMGKLIDAITSNPQIRVRTGCQVVACEGEAGSFKVTLALQDSGTQEVVEAGAIIVATGFQHFDPGRETQVYGYYEYPDVITLSEAEAMLKAKHFVRPSNGQPPERLCFIQCVGSRDRQIGNEYCSKVCCGIASKQAIEIRQLVPNCKVYIFYIDMRMYGFWENEIYWPAQEKYKVNYIRGIATEITRKGDKLLVRGEDTTLGRPMEVLMDMVILSVGMEPSAGTRRIAKVLGLAQNKYGFIDVPHAGIDPVATSVPGIFVAGAAAGPKDLDDSMSMAGAAATKAVTTLRRAQASVPAPSSPSNPNLS